MFNLRKVKQLRTKQKLTQAELSRLSDVTIQTISKIENGHCDAVDTATIEKLAKGLKVKPKVFLK